MRRTKPSLATKAATPFRGARHDCANGALGVLQGRARGARGMTEKSVTIAAFIGGTTYLLVYPTDAIEALVAETGKPAAELPYVISDRARLGAREMRFLLWVGLRTHHPEMTLRQAGALLDEGLPDLGYEVSIALSFGLAAIGEFHVADDSVKH